MNTMPRIFTKYCLLLLNLNTSIVRILAALVVNSFFYLSLTPSIP